MRMACMAFLALKRESEADKTCPAIPSLPANPLGDWIAAKQSKVWGLQQASDQVSVLAVGVPGFVTTAETVSVASLVGPSSTTGPDLAADPAGSDWLVTQVSGGTATMRFWEALTKTAAYGP